MDERRAWVVPVFAVPLMMAIPAFFGRVFLYRDILGLVIPQQVFRTRALAEGRLAQWNPLSYGGTPFLADPGVGTFYPPNLLFSLVHPPALAATVFVLLHFAVAGAGMLLLLRGHRPLIATIGAVAYQTSGYLLSMHGMHYACSSVALLPLAIALLLDEKRIALGAAALAVLILNGELQVVAFAAAIALVLAGRNLLRTLAALGLAAGLGAVQVLPTMLFSRQTVRVHGVPLADASLWSLHPTRWIEWLVPSPLGVGYPDNHFFGTALLEPGRTSPWAAGLALGGCLALAVALVQWRAAKVRAWAIVGAFALLLAAGHHTPLFALWWRFVPLANRFRYAEKYAAVTTLALVVLAAQGLDDGLQRSGNRYRWLWAAPILLALGALVVLAAPAPLVAFVADGLHRASANIDPAGALAELAATLFSSALLAAVLVLSLELMKRRPAAGLWAVLGTVVVGGLLQANRLLSWGDGSFLETRPPLVQRLVDARNPVLAGRVFRDRCPFVPLDDHGTLLERVRRWEWMSAKPNFPSLFGVPDAVGYGPAESAEKWRVFRTLGAQDEQRMLRLLGVTHRIRCSPAGKIELEDFSQPLPRVSMEKGKAELIEDHPESLRIRVSGAGGVLRLLDSYDAGWTATVDGVPATISPADELWRGVPVPPGDHEVRFRYCTPGLVAGAWISLVALVVMIVIARRQSRRTPGAAI